MVYGLEVGATEHLQGYLELTCSQRVTLLKQLLPRIHYEHRRGTALQAANYCKKDGLYFEFGEMTRQGKRTDLQDLVKAARSSGSLYDTWLVAPSVSTHMQFYKALRSEWLLLDAPAWRDLKVRVFVGPTGTGKTREAMATMEREKTYLLDIGHKVWFDGYTSQEHLVIDDFYGWITYGFLLRLLDGYPCRLEIKGGFVSARWTLVTITSNKPYLDWYSQRDLSALERRITEIKTFE